MSFSPSATSKQVHPCSEEVKALPPLPRLERVLPFLPETSQTIPPFSVKKIELAHLKDLPCVQNSTASIHSQTKASASPIRK
eukprot:c19507_g2_i2 orf=442-687(+)